MNATLKNVIFFIYAIAKIMLLVQGTIYGFYLELWPQACFYLLCSMLINLEK